MIICRTPLRVSFFGGGTDYPDWYQSNGGAVISATINKYNYVTARYLPPFFDYKHRIRYYLNEEVNEVEQIQHPVVREVIKYLGIEDGLELVHNSDLPARSGLGSSSSFTVGLLNVLHSLLKNNANRFQLASEAMEIEQSKIGECVGSQDQVAASYGGLNLIEFAEDEQFNVKPIRLSADHLNILESHMLLVFTGFARTASEVAKEQIKVTKQKSSELSEISQICKLACDCLSSLSFDVKEIGYLLNKQWLIKRTITELISNPKIDQIYKIGMDNGAMGGKLLGAGGGGFMLFIAAPELHNKIKNALNQKMFVPIKLENRGSEIIYSSGG